MGSLDGRVANTHPAAQKRVLDAGSMVADKLSPSIAPPPVMRCRHVTMPSFRVVICPLSPWVCYPSHERLAGGLRVVVCPCRLW